MRLGWELDHKPFKVLIFVPMTCQHGGRESVSHVVLRRRSIAIRTIGHSSGARQETAVPTTPERGTARMSNELTGRTLGQYELIEQIGRGGMASVYKARALERGGGIVAVKILAPQLAVDPTFQARFLREAEVLSQLRHPNIMPVFDYGEADGYLFIVMPFMQVGGLSDRLRRGPLGVQEGARIFRQIASALQYAHHKGIIHRDVKLSNILLDAEGNAWLSDFGFVHIDDSNLSLTGSALVGTPAYIAPELVEGQSPTPHTDQYSLGVVLYQMSTGKLPYEAETPMAMAIKHLMEPLPRPRAVNPKLPDAVEQVITKALSKDPSQRYDSVEALCDAFEGSLAQAIDIDSGVVKPGARGEDPVTEVLEKPKLEAEARPRQWWRWAALAAVLLLACPLGTWFAVTSMGDSFALGRTETEALSIEDVQFTVVAMVTASAQPAGTFVPPGYVETVVYQTMAAKESEAAIASRNGNQPSVTPSGPILTGTHDADATQVGSETPEPGMDVSPTATWPGTGSATPRPSATSPPPAQPASETPDRGSGSGATHTRTPTRTRTLTPTSTRTITPTPSVTKTATITLSPTPSPTPTVDFCALIVLDGFEVDKKDVLWFVTNNSGQTITIVDIYLDWPSAGVILEKVKFGGKDIWKVGDDAPPTHINSNWNGALKDRQLEHGKKEDLKFEFQEQPGPSGYDLELTFDLGCTFTSSK